jgi:hypothetical protein
VIETVVIPCDDVILAIGQENAFPWIERDVGIDFDENNMPIVDKATMQSSRAGVFFGGDAAWGRRTSSGPSSTDIRRRSRSTTLSERSADGASAYGMNLVSAKVGMHAWSYSNDYSSVPRTKMQHAELTKRFSGSTSKSSSASRRAERREKSSAASTATSDALHASSASSATRASTSVR